METPFRKVCDRCGDSYHETDQHEVLRIAYEIEGYLDVDSDVDKPLNKWRTLNLCEDCQKTLRDEFYTRGLLWNLQGW